MCKLFKSNAFFLPICDKFRNLNTKFRNFFPIFAPENYQ